MSGAMLRVPVITSFLAGWAFPFLQAHRLVFRLALPVGVLIALQVFGLTPQSAQTWTNSAAPNELVRFFNDVFFIVFIYGVHLTATVFVIAAAYRTALGIPERFALARLEIGRDEIYLWLGKIGIWAVVLLLFAGSAYVTFQILNLGLSNQPGMVEFIVKMLGGEAVLEEFQSFEGLAIGAPLIVLGPILIWLGLRYSLVFPYLVAERRFRIFSALSLTKGSAWRLAVLWVLLWASLIFAMKVPLLYVGALTFKDDAPPMQFADEVYAFVTTYDLGPPLKFEARKAPAVEAPAEKTGVPLFTEAEKAPQRGRAILPAWLAPIVTVLGNVLWQLVFAGALAHAYRAVAARAALE